MTATHDLIVIGAGPAGANAAMTAREHGLSVALFDEQAAAGGQVWRAPWPGLSRQADTVEAREGDALRSRLSATSVDFRPGRRVWSVTSDFRVDALGPDGNEAATAPLLIAATGAHERVVPFPGWTLPGVVGLAAATVLLKAHHALPGRRVIVAGCGPLLAAVAAGIVKAGGEVVAIADLAGPGDWLKALPSMASRPRLLAQGFGWALRLAGRRVPIHFRHGVRSADGEERLSSVRLGPVSADGAPSAGREIVLEADALCVGHGLVPGAEISKLLRAAHVYDALRGGWVPEVDAFGRTSVAGLSAVGDGSGLRGAAPSEIAGRLAGLAAARDAGKLGAAAFERAAAPVLKARAGLTAFADASARMMALRPAQVAAIPPETVVCRCEDVTRAEIDAACEAGAREVNQLKHFTRCGMGPCQGRMCGDVAAELLAARVGGRQAAGYWTGRPPLRPVGIEALIGRFNYEDIPIPTPAPL
jgi:thioredoxin reductase/bacterioferritin-associated ferredoxin